MSFFKRSLTDDQVRAIRAAEGRYAEIAAKFGTHAPTVSNIKNRKTYRWVSADPSIPSVLPTHNTQKLSDAEVRFIRESEETHAAIARRFGVQPGYVGDLRAGRYRREAGGPIRKPRKVPAKGMPSAKREALRSDLLEISRLYGLNLSSRWPTTPSGSERSS